MLGSALARVAFATTARILENLMSEYIYNIPAQQLPIEREGWLIVRTDEPAVLPTILTGDDLGAVVAVQLSSLASDSEALNAWTAGLPIELMMDDPAAEFPLLYRHTNLLDHHPVRVVIPVRPGFAKAVKVAVALEFAVRLDVGQPDPALIEELAAVLEFYLRQSSVAQPIEYFHGTLLGLFHAEPLPLWVIQDEEPGVMRYVTDEGQETMVGRLAEHQFALPPDASLVDWTEQALATAEDCRDCEFFLSCGGYFKWPRADYDCGGVKRIFGLLRDAAAELRRDLEAGPA